MFGTLKTKFPIFDMEHMTFSPARSMGHRSQLGPSYPKKQEHVCVIGLKIPFPLQSKTEHEGPVHPGSQTQVPVSGSQ